MDQISYRNGYKYQLAADAHYQTDIFPPQEVSNRFVKLTPDGLMTLRQDYAWDGPSGPTADTPAGMYASLPHDGGYQLMREGLLDEATYKPQFDALFYKLLLIGGMAPHRAKSWYRGVQIFGEPSANPANDKPILVAP